MDEEKGPSECRHIRRISALSVPARREAFETLRLRLETVADRLRIPERERSHLLIAADCSAYAYGDFHRDFIQGRVTLIGCPKLDAVDYSEKLTRIIAGNDIRSLTIVRMEVPCCGGLENAAKKALRDSGKFIPWQVVTLSTDGRIL